jgi:hypothetical protein
MSYASYHWTETAYATGTGVTYNARVPLSQFITTDRDVFGTVNSVVDYGDPSTDTLGDEFIYMKKPGIYHVMARAFTQAPSFSTRWPDNTIPLFRAPIPDWPFGISQNAYAPTHGAGAYWAGFAYEGPGPYGYDFSGLGGAIGDLWAPGGPAPDYRVYPYAMLTLNATFFLRATAGSGIDPAYFVVVNESGGNMGFYAEMEIVAWTSDSFSPTSEEVF